MSKMTKERTKKMKGIVIECLEQSLGVVTTACKKANIHRSTFYEWMKEDEKFESKVREIQDVAIDFAESKLFHQIEKGNVASIIFYLKTKGKNRGYIERTEHTGLDGEPLNPPKLEFD